MTSLSHGVAAADGADVVYRLPVDLLINLGGPPAQLAPCSSQLTPAGLTIATPE